MVFRDKVVHALDDRGRLLFVGGLVLMAFAFFVGAVLAGRELLISGHLWPSDILFGFDIERNLRAISERGFNGRSNVHPLFAPTVKPFALLIQRMGITAGMSAIILNAAAGMGGLLLTAWYLRLRGVSRLDAWLLCLLMASTAIWIFQSALPGTYIFSLCIIVISHILLYWTVGQADPRLRPRIRGLREGAWFISAVLNYGFTVTNGFLSFLTYGFARRGWKSWARATVWAAGVLICGVALSWLVGSQLNIGVEHVWLHDASMRGQSIENPFLHSFSTYLVWGFVAPIARMGTMTDPRGWDIITFHEWNYSAVGWCVAMLWTILFALAAWAMLTDPNRDSRRFSLALVACFVFHALLHCFYHVSYEGVFVWSSHSLFLIIGMFAPFAVRVSGRGPMITAWRSALLALALVLAFRHFALLVSLKDRVPLPAGFGG